MASLSDSFGSTHKPTLAWATSISGIIIGLVVVLLIVWILRRTSKDG